MGRSITLISLVLLLTVTAGAAPLPAQVSNPQASGSASGQARGRDGGQQRPGATMPTAEELATLRREVEQDLANVDKRLRFAQALIAAGKIGPAMDQLEEALAHDPENAQGHAYLGLCYQLRSRVDDAVAAYRRALELAPDLLAAHNALAVLLAARGRNAEAEEHLERAVALAPEAVEPRLELASVLLRSGRAGDALARLEEADEMSGGSDPRVGYALSLLLSACIQETVCDPGRALALADALYRSQPTPGHAQLLALALGASDRFDEAVQVQSELIAVAEKAGLGGEMVRRMRRTLQAFERHERPDELFAELIGDPEAASSAPQS